MSFLSHPPISHGCHWLTLSGFGYEIPLGLEKYARKRVYRGNDLVECPGEFWDVLGGSAELVLDVKGRARATRFDYAIDIPDGPDPWEVYESFQPLRSGMGWRKRGAKFQNDLGRTAYIGVRGSSPVLLCVYNQRGPTRFEFRFSSVNNFAESAVAMYSENRLLDAVTPMLWFYPKFASLTGGKEGIFTRVAIEREIVERERRERVDRAIHRMRRLLAEFAAVYGSEWIMRMERIIEAASQELDIEPEPPEIPDF